MKQSGDTLLVTVALVALLIVSFSSGVFYFAEDSDELVSGGVTGNSIKSDFIAKYTQWNRAQQILFLSQFPLIVLVISLLSVRHFKKMKKTGEITKEDIARHTRKNQTDLDTLYSILQSKKLVHLSSIATSFNVDKNVAMEWCRTLESSNMGSVEYPTFGDPYIRAKKEEDKTNKSEVSNTKSEESVREEATPKQKTEKVAQEKDNDKKKP